MKMKILLLAGVFALSGLLGCTNQKKAIISELYVDSLINNYHAPEFVLSNDSSMQFWKNRINPALPGLVSESKYAGFLSMRFHLFGDIRDIIQADSTIKKVDLDFNHNEAQANLTLVSYSILQHRFKEADTYLEKAKQIGLKKYDLL